MTSVLNETETWAWLRSQDLELAIDRQSGALVSLRQAGGDWTIQGHPALAVGWRLLVPLPERRNNQVRNEDQAPPSIRVDPEGSRLTLAWDEVRSVHGGLHSIGIKQTITVQGRHATFETSIDNRSDLTVENVWAPYIGDLRPTATGEELKTFYSSYGGATELSMFPTFANTAGYWEVDRRRRSGPLESAWASFLSRPSP